MRRCIFFACLGLGLLAAPGCKPGVDDVCKVRAKLSPVGAGKAFDHEECVASLEKRKERNPKEFQRYAECMMEAREPKDTVECELGDIKAATHANEQTVCALINDNFEVWPEDKQGPCLRGEKFLAKKNAGLHAALLSCVGDPVKADSSKERRRLGRVKRKDEQDCLVRVIQDHVADKDLPFEPSGVAVCDATTKFEVACFEELPHAPSDGAQEHVGRKAKERKSSADTGDKAKLGGKCRVILAKEAIALVEGCLL